MRAQKTDEMALLLTHIHTKICMYKYTYIYIRTYTNRIEGKQVNK